MEAKSNSGVNSTDYFKDGLGAKMHVFSVGLASPRARMCACYVGSASLGVRMHASLF